MVTILSISSDRADISVYGQPFGQAVANEYGGWNVFEGSFPQITRQRRLDGCTLDEVRRNVSDDMEEDELDYCGCCLHVPCMCQDIEDRAAS